MAKKKEMKQISKFMAAVGMFGMDAMKALHFSTVKLNERRGCLCCGRRHQHNNAFCDEDCCSDWRTENPQRGRLNHKHDPKTGLVLVNGVELV